MLFVFAVIVLSIEECSITIQGGNIPSIKPYNMCNNLTFENIVAKDDIFINVDNYEEINQQINITIVKSDLSQIKTFINGANKPMKSITVTVINSTIRRAFKGYSRISKIIFINCVLNATMLTEDGHWFYATKMYFYNCEFVGKHTYEKTGIIRFDCDDKFESILVEFSDCKFNLDKNWNKKEVDGIMVDSPEKHFILVQDQRGKIVQINFIRCIAGENLIDESHKLLRFTNKDANEFSTMVEGITNGITIDMSWALNDNNLWNETNWTTAVRDEGYNPPIPQPSEVPSETPEKQNGPFDKINTWKIITYSLSCVCVVLIVIVLVVCAMKRQIYNRSE